MGLQLGTIFGIGFVTWLQIQSIYEINKLCPWCMVVWAMMIPLFVGVTARNLRAFAPGSAVTRFVSNWTDPDRRALVPRGGGGHLVPVRTGAAVRLIATVCAVTLSYCSHSRHFLLPETVLSCNCELPRSSHRSGAPRATSHRSTARPWLRRLRRAGHALTTPLAPDDYFTLINPLWSARELRGRVEQVVKETERAATLVIKPGWGWTFDHAPGQYIGIGVEIDGKYHWRSYSLSSVPLHENGTVSITIKAMPEGFMSDHLVNGLEPGTIVRLAAPQGDFVLPDPPPEKLLFLVGGSGITPVMSILRTLDRRQLEADAALPDTVLAYSATNEDDMMFVHELRVMALRYPNFTFHRTFHRHRRHPDPRRARRRRAGLARARHLGLRPGTHAGCVQRAVRATTG